MSHFFDLVSAVELNDAIEIEEQAFPPDEAASLAAFQYRQAEAPELFMGVFEPDAGNRRLLGYICSTLSPSTTLTHESMSTHVKNSTSICIHAIAILPDLRRRGLGSQLLQEYVRRLETEPERYSLVLLITHIELKPFYERCGFELVGESTVKHGSGVWYEMRRVIDAPPQQSLPQEYSSDKLWEALRASSSRSRPDQTTFDSLSSDVIVVGEDGQPRNKHNLLCPRKECASIILKADVARLVERSSVQIDPLSHPSHPLLPPLPAPPQSMKWWLITPSPMQFENIGFSKPVEGAALGSGGKPLKLLACAECDLGPLGWCEGGTEFWLAPGRVGYQTTEPV